jgi:cobalt-zinc-cadmium efflux system outer membrane protein
MRPRCLFSWLIWVPLASGCCLTPGKQIDQEVRDIAARIGVDAIHSDNLPPLPAPLPLNGKVPPPVPASATPDAPSRPATPSEAKVPPPSAASVTLERPVLKPVAALQANEPGPARRLLIPEELPGGEAAPIRLPLDRAERAQVIAELYPPIPPLPAEPPPAPGPEGHPLTLFELQHLAEEYSPAVKSAFAAVQAARGAAYQAGQYPNPTLAFEHDTVETGPAGYPGFFFDQVIKTGGKLTVAQAAATMDVLSAELTHRRARADARNAVRGNYFAVLVALENLRVSDALFRFSEYLYRLQIDLLKSAGLAAGYEPMQLRPLVLQAQLNLLQARNQYHASWRQLAANLGLPDMPPSELEGQIDVPVPVFDYDAVLDRLRNHTDVLTAQVAIEKAKYTLKQQKLVPLPDVELRLLVQKDYSTPPNQVAHSAVFSAQVPLWDQNLGGIRQAEWQLAQAAVGPEQTRNALIGTLADAFNRYQTARRAVEIAGQQIRDQVRVYRGIHDRRQRAATEVGFGDLVTAQQTLAGYVTGYVTALGQQWQAVVDVANYLQTEEIFQSAEHQQGVEPLPDLRHLLPPPAPVVGPHAAAGTPGCEVPPSPAPQTIGGPENPGRLDFLEAPPGLPATPPPAPPPMLPAGHSPDGARR